MKTHGMTFREGMVQAIIDGRKNQTRRPMIPQPDAAAQLKCPWEAGDRIWLKEGHAIYQTVDYFPRYHGGAFSEISDGQVAYKADGYETIEELRDHLKTMTGQEIREAVEIKEDRWASASGMPRWASRIFLEVTEVRAQRIQEISDLDLLMEGVMFDYVGEDQRRLRRNEMTYLWDSIHGAGSWDRNDWVWAISFKVLELKGRAE